jgi:branched-chain amino acid aminotransferase
LYVWPTMVARSARKELPRPSSALLFVIARPVNPYYPTGFKVMSLEATDYAVRALPGGVGDQKLGASYAPRIMKQVTAASRGFHQSL